MFYSFSVGKGVTATLVHRQVEAGFLAGEIVRRATGRPLADVLRDDLAAPLGHPDEIWFGMPETDRLAVLEDGSSDPDWARHLPADAPLFRAGPMSLLPTAALGNDPRMLAADIPAGAKVSARAVARMYAAVIGDALAVTQEPAHRGLHDGPAGRRDRAGGDLTPSAVTSLKPGEESRATWR